MTEMRREDQWQGKALKKKAGKLAFNNQTTWDGDLRKPIIMGLQETWIDLNLNTQKQDIIQRFTENAAALKAQGQAVSQGKEYQN